MGWAVLSWHVFLRIRRSFEIIILVYQCETLITLNLNYQTKIPVPRGHDIILLLIFCIYPYRHPKQGGMLIYQTYSKDLIF